MSTTMQRELKINQAIDDQLNKILEDMQKLLDASRIWESRMEVGQIQNLLTVAQETDSVEVVKNYIRYQIGRDTTGSSWRRRVGTGPVFGEQIIAELDELKGTASTLVPQEDTGEFEVDRTWMKMTRLYLGYMRRYFYYKKRSAE
ncbi:MAG: hypothetical protein IPJ94_11365 [Chloroflexi bacterium]|nr:hypothetical protein [Chloroflexota bacterium]